MNQLSLHYLWFLLLVYISGCSTEKGHEDSSKLSSTTNSSLTALTWKRSLPIGTKDPNGTLIGGTELRALSSFDGKLFAANGYWTDRHMDQPWLPGAQVFRLDKPLAEGGQWVIDFQLDERMPNSNRRRFHTISEMKAVRFEHDSSGQPLATPVDLLVMGVWDRSTGLHVFTRDTSGPSSWTKSTIVPETGAKAPWHVRSFSIHRDAVTGADLLLAGTSGHANVPRGIYSAVYDASSPGKLRWKSSQEAWDTTPGPNDRVMSMTVANGKIYATVCGKLYERQDGSNPKWVMRYKHPSDRCPTTPGEWSYRGATTIDNADGSQSIIASMEGTSLFGRWDFKNGLRAGRELDLRAFLAQGLKRQEIQYTIAAYNGFAKIKLPDGRNVHFAGIEALIGEGRPNTWHGWQRGAWFVARMSSNSFQLHHIPPENGEGAMVAVRAMIQSPFASEPHVIYAGGFDANHVENENHNTAWLYRGAFTK